MAARCKAWVYDRSFVGIAGSNPAEGMGVSLASVVRCQTELSTSG